MQNCKRKFSSNQSEIALKETGKFWQEIYQKYIIKKETIEDVANNLKLSKKTILRHFEKLPIPTPPKQDLKEVIVMLDATYWGENFGVIIFLDALSGRFIWWKFIYGDEKPSDFKEGILWCESVGYEVKGVVGDGLKGLSKALNKPMQLCQVHKQRNIRTKLTNRPKSEAARELLNFSNRLTRVSKTEFIDFIKNFEVKHEKFLNETSVDEKGRKIYTHKRLISALRSLKRNSDLLFKFEEIYSLPKSTNPLEGRFKVLKDLTRNHSGLKEYNLKRFISYYLLYKIENFEAKS